MLFRSVLQHCVNRFQERFDELSYALCVEAGKPIRDARGEVTRLIDTFRIAAEESVRILGEVQPLDIAPRATNARLYTDANPLTQMDFAAKTSLLQEIDAYARARDPRVVQVMASITGEWQAVQILRPDGQRFADLRPLVRFNVSVVVAEGEDYPGNCSEGLDFSVDASGVHRINHPHMPVMHECR